MAENTTKAGSVLKVVNLHKRFNTGLKLTEVHAVKGVSIEVQPGEIFGYLGPNGAGKTTTMKMVMGLIQPTEGSIYLYDALATNPSVRQNIGYLPEHPYFYDYLTAVELLDFYGRLFGLTGKQCAKRADELLDLVGLNHAKNRRLRSYSKGMLQRTGIAQAMINDPNFLILDEPLGGLDPIGRKEVRDIILSLQERGKTIFFSSHILHDIETICDRVAIIQKGEVESVGPLEELLSGTDAVSDVVVALGAEAQDTDTTDLCDQLKAKNIDVTVTGSLLNMPVSDEQLSDIIGVCLAAGARIKQVSPRKETLEEFFMREAGGRGR